ncbi:hypothetical protein Q3G72_023507 [Acer saccharum]|nr:hypothetical protein Q3G72_023507 [Acer saccharum]
MMEGLRLRMMTNIGEGGDALEKNILVTEVAISITTMGNGEIADTGGKRRKVTVENSDSHGGKLARKQNAVTDADGGNSTATMEHILPILYEVGVEAGGDNSEPDEETKVT